MWTVRSLHHHSDLLLNNLPFPAKNLNRTVGNDFVCIHVQRSTRTSLDRIYDKVLMQFSCKDFITCLYDCFCLFLFQNPTLAVGDRRCFLYVRKTVDDLGCIFSPVIRKFSAARSDCTPVIYISRNIFLPLLNPVLHDNLSCFLFHFPSQNPSIFHFLWRIAFVVFIIALCYNII